jgi:hypothetical protein
MNICSFILIPYLTLASRFHGGGFISAPRIVRSLVFILPYIILTFHIPFIICITAALFAYIGKNIGHEDFWGMDTLTSRPDRNWLAKVLIFFKLKPDTKLWCWLGMGIKGAITALGTLNPLVIALHAVALPTAYWIGRNTKLSTELAEYLSGFFYALILLAFL